MSRFRWSLVTVGAVLASTAISQAVASPLATQSSVSLSSQVSGLTRRLNRDEAAIRALRAQRISVEVVYNQQNFGSYGSDEAQALCPAGETTVGGGAGWGGPDGGFNINDRMIVSEPSLFPNGSAAGWIASGQPGQVELQPFGVYALCAKLG